MFAIRQKTEYIYATPLLKNPNYIYEPLNEKINNLHDAKLISGFVFATEILCACTAWFLSPLFGNHDVGLLMRRLVYDHDVRNIKNEQSKNKNTNEIHTQSIRFPYILANK